MRMTVTVVGLGLIGGSLVKALRGWNDAIIIGVDSDEAVLERALADGAIDESFSTCGGFDEALASDVVVISTPPRAALRFIEENGRKAAKKSIWTDMVGVKQVIMEQVERFLPRAVDFIGGHPMAGMEKFGYANSIPSLFRGCNYLLTPRVPLRAQSLSLIEEMVHYIGANEITYTDAQNHDRMIAYVSQQAHILAPAIIKSENYYRSLNYEGPSFHDLTRVGTLDPYLWSELFLLNKGPLAAVIKELETNLCHLRTLITDSDETNLTGALSESSRRRAELNRQKIALQEESEQTETP